jgi:glycyl-tRNA synthetase beta chain
LPELLIELRSEDIPARMQAKAADDLKSLVLDGLKAAGLAWEKAEAHSTPRRLALVVDGLPARTADVREERRGPRDGAPEQAVQGFLKANGLTSLEQCEKRDTGKGVFWFAVVEKPGRATAEILPGVAADAVLRLPWPKSMRFGHSTLAWVRPLQSILAVFDGEEVEGAIAVGDHAAGRPARLLREGEVPPDREAVLPFGDTTVGHRFLSPGLIRVSGFADYREKLRAAHVILDREERKAVIRAEAERLAAAEGLVVKPDDALLDEVAGLVEWPVVLVGGFDPAFLDVPPEVLTTTMRVNQKYFALTRPDGTLAPRFVVVANRTARDGGAAIVQGNERVLRARLSDARFFWEQDKAVRLEDRLPDLVKITFHAKLGTVAERVERIRKLSVEIAKAMKLSGADEMRADRAAQLAKADLVSGMVGEFPELQGLMGRHYALAEGEETAVADAIADHYKPQGPADRCPSAPVSVAVALAEKIDTLVGFFAIDEKPTGSKDPFALRRAALGVIRLIVENGLRVGLARVLTAAARVYPPTPALPPGGGGGAATTAVPSPPRGEGQGEGAARSPVVADLLAFFADRLKVAMREKGVRHDVIDAVFALGGEDDLVRLLARVDAVQAFLSSEDGANLLVAYRRAANIVRIEEKKDGREYRNVHPGSFVADEEHAVWNALTGIQTRTDELVRQELFVDAMKVLATSRAPIDAFFDRVTVNVDDPDLRANRLALLRRIMATMHALADFSRIEG